MAKTTGGFTLRLAFLDVIDLCYFLMRKSFGLVDGPGRFPHHTRTMHNDDDVAWTRPSNDKASINVENPVWSFNVTVLHMPTNIKTIHL